LVERFLWREKPLYQGLTEVSSHPAHSIHPVGIYGVKPGLEKNLLELSPSYNPEQSRAHAHSLHCRLTSTIKFSLTFQQVERVPFCAETSHKEEQPWNDR
jgi:hypothetical protein